MQASSFFKKESCDLPCEKSEPGADKNGSRNYLSDLPAKSTRFSAALLRIVGAAALAIAMLAQPVATMAPGAPHLVASALPSAGAPARSQFFAATGKAVKGGFLGTLNRFGIERIGYPLSDEQQENGTTVQYFERVRMEYHPELASKGYGVLMSRLGVDLNKDAHFARVAAVPSSRDLVYFNQTGHSLSNSFLTYWQKNGGVELFGYPISEPMMQDGMLVQWFERARFEYHPDVASGVLLTTLGRLTLEKEGVRPPAAVPASQVRTQAPETQAPAQSQPQVSLSDTESYMLKAINDQRAAAGLAPVQINAGLTGLARSRSNDMAARNYFSHTTPEGANFLGMLGDRGIAYKYAGEILARNNYPDDQAANTAMTSYLNSAPHKAIMLDGRYTQVGVGYSKAGDSMQYFTVIFVQQ